MSCIIKNNKVFFFFFFFFFAFSKTMARTSSAVTATLISVFVFATRIVKFLFFLNPNFKIPLLWLYRPVCVRPGRKPRRPAFSRRGSNKVKADAPGHVIHEDLL